MYIYIYLCNLPLTGYPRTNMSIIALWAGKGRSSQVGIENQAKQTESILGFLQNNGFVYVNTYFFV